MNMQNCGAFVYYERHVQWVGEGCVINYNTQLYRYCKVVMV